MAEKQFWDWFVDNKIKLEQFIRSDSNDYSLYNELTKRLTSYNENVIPELTMDSSDNYVLIISCDGRRDGIKFVERLFDARPSIEKWIVQKYRSPGDVTELNYDGLEFKSNDINVKYSMSDNVYDIDLFIKGYSESDQRYKALAFLYLDHLVGEYNVMTKIGHIKFKKPGLFASTSDKVTLQEFRAIIERLN
jgi:hypothetical protein